MYHEPSISISAGDLAPTLPPASRNPSLSFGPGSPSKVAVNADDRARVHHGPNEPIFHRRTLVAPWTGLHGPVEQHPSPPRHHSVKQLLIRLKEPTAGSPSACSWDGGRAGDPVQRRRRRSSGEALHPPLGRSPPAAPTTPPAPGGARGSSILAFSVSEADPQGLPPPRPVREDPALSVRVGGVGKTGRSGQRVMSPSSSPLRARVVEDPVFFQHPAAQPDSSGESFAAASPHASWHSATASPIPVPSSGKRGAAGSRRAGSASSCPGPASPSQGWYGSGSFCDLGAAVPSPSGASVVMFAQHDFVITPCPETGVVRHSFEVSRAHQLASADGAGRQLLPPLLVIGSAPPATGIGAEAAATSSSSIVQGGRPLATSLPAAGSNRRSLRRSGSGAGERADSSNMIADDAGGCGVSFLSSLFLRGA